MSPARLRGERWRQPLHPAPGSDSTCQVGLAALTEPRQPSKRSPRTAGPRRTAEPHEWPGLRRTAESMHGQASGRQQSCWEPQGPAGPAGPHMPVGLAPAHPELPVAHVPVSACPRHHYEEWLWLFSFLFFWAPWVFTAVPGSLRLQGGAGLQL